MKGWLIKVYQDISRDRFTLYFLDVGGSILKRELNYKPKLYLSGDPYLIKRIIYRNKEYIDDFYRDTWYIPPWYRVHRDIWVLTPVDLETYYKMIKIFSGYHSIRLWNLFPSIKIHLLLDYNLSPFTLVDINNLEMLEDPLSIYYEYPSIRRIYIQLLDWYGDVYYPFKYPPKSFKVKFYKGPENFIEYYNSLGELIESVNNFRPHVIEAGYTEVFKYLSKSIDLRNYIKIDYSRSVLKPSEFPGFIELSRLSRVGLDEVSRYSIGKILTTIESIEALKLKYLIPDVRVDIENFKDVDRLTKIDRGGYVYTPSPGLYWNVAQCDFTSLYPSIIAKYNIGNESVNYIGCKRYIIAPESEHRICLDRRSIVSRAMELLVNRRILLKDLSRDRGDPILDARQRALKWILVASFGYLGYRNARFGKIEAYEAVTSYARDILLKAINIAEARGFRVVHALVDSIFVTREDASLSDYLLLCKEISEKTGFRMEIDFHYKWLYIPVNRSLKYVGSINRYFGVSYDNRLKVKGIELIRKDAPDIVKDFQMEVIDKLADAKDYSEFKFLTGESIKILDKYKSLIRNFRVDPTKLIVTKSIRKIRYGGVISKVIKALGTSKVNLVRYIMSVYGPIPVERWSERNVYDPEYYIKLIYASLESLPYSLFYKTSDFIKIFR